MPNLLVNPATLGTVVFIVCSGHGREGSVQCELPTVSGLHVNLKEVWRQVGNRYRYFIFSKYLP